MLVFKSMGVLVGIDNVHPMRVDPLHGVLVEEWKVISDQFRKLDKHAHGNLSRLDWWSDSPPQTKCTTLFR